MRGNVVSADIGTNSHAICVTDLSKEGIEQITHLETCIIHSSDSTASDRRVFKSARDNRSHKRGRKISLLMVLKEYGFCPSSLTEEELREWKDHKKFPTDPAFREWLNVAEATDDAQEKSPWYDRHRCIFEELDFEKEEDRLTFGRTLYHMNKKRGYRSNRKDTSPQKESDAKIVADAIERLDNEMAKNNIDFIGEFFYQAHRGLITLSDKNAYNYKDRDKHVQKEFSYICEKQNIDKDLAEKIRSIIFDQRPIKSQKRLVGNCCYEKDRKRCYRSHPLFEQYRMYTDLTNIKIKTPEDDNFRQLTDDEQKKVIHLYLRKSKPRFKFEEIAKELTPKGKRYGSKGDIDCDYLFNFKDTQTLRGCQTIASLSNVFGVKEKDNPDAWLEKAYDCYAKKKDKDRYNVMNDIWHVLKEATEDAFLKQWAMDNLGFDEKKAEEFSKIRLEDGYDKSVSFKAIRKILPYMKKYGLQKHKADYMANLVSVLPNEIDKESEDLILKDDVARDIMKAFDDYKNNDSEITLGAYFEGYIHEVYGISLEELNKKIWNPNQEYGVYTKGKSRDCLPPIPMGKVRNPIVRKSLACFEKMVNRVIEMGKVDRDSIFFLETTRGWNSASEKEAIEKLQLYNEKKNNEAIKEIKKIKGENYIPTSDDIKRCLLWHEQVVPDGDKIDGQGKPLMKHISIFTGDEIPFEAILDGRLYNIDHTIARCRRGETTMSNLTLCESWYNQDIKGSLLPTELGDYKKIEENIKPWLAKIATLKKRIKATSDMVYRHIAEEELRYWEDKCRRFQITEVPEDFFIRQIVDTSIIAKIVTPWLKTYFKDVRPISGRFTANVRKLWGLQEEGLPKDRSNHTHHSIDAIILAFASNEISNNFNSHVRGNGNRKWDFSNSIPLPWPTFVDDVQEYVSKHIINHITKDNVGKQTSRKVYAYDKGKSGKRNCGHTARGSLHKDTLFGRIINKEYSQDKKEHKYLTVLRTPITDVTMDKVKNIVDKKDREIITQALMDNNNSMKEALAKGPIWKNEEKKIPIKSVRMIRPDVVDPLPIRKHQYVSRQEHKRTCWSVNDKIYSIGIYEKGDFLAINNMEAMAYTNIHTKQNFPFEHKGQKLKYTIKVGTMIILHENSVKDMSDEESRKLTESDISKRLYRVYGIDKFGNIKLEHHQASNCATKEKADHFFEKYGIEARKKIRPNYLLSHGVVL